MDFLQNLNFSNDYWLILLPLILMITDIITGYYVAWKNKVIKSSVMRDGIGKKIAEIVYIVIGVVVGLAFNIDSVSVFVSLYIIYMELISIIENCKELGVDAPKEIEDRFMKKKGFK